MKEKRRNPIVVNCKKISREKKIFFFLLVSLSLSIPYDISLSLCFY